MKWDYTTHGIVLCIALSRMGQHFINRMLQLTVNKVLPMRGNAINTLPNMTKTDTMHKN
jgi:hypothetical protein